jgi:protein ImuB
MPRRYLAIWLKFWATDRRRRMRQSDNARTPADRARDTRPLALVEAVGPRRQIAAADAQALDLGVAPGLGVADAQAIVPDLRIEPADREGDLAALHRLAEWATRFSPLVTPDSPDGLMLDVTGCAHLWGGEEKLLGDVLRRLRGNGFAACGAIAGTIGAAWAAARFGDAPAGTILPAGAVSGALAGLPVQALRIDAATADGLGRLGLRRIGDLYPMKRSGLAQRFGTALITRLDQALGCAGETLSPLSPPPDHRVTVSFAEPIATPDSIRRVAEILVERLARELAEHQRGARGLKLFAYRIDGAVSTVAIGTARASAETRHLFHLLAEKLEQIDPGPGIECASLAATRTEILSPVQSGMIDTDEAAISAADLAPLMDRLANRLGADRLARPRPEESHVPERAIKMMPPLAEAKKKAPWPNLPPRPTRLLPNPEPIEVMALVPDEPPVTFRWRRITHRVTWAEGPERIAPEWWRPTGNDADESRETRDYYRVQDESGGRYWVYRAGLYQNGKTLPRWFLHGVFA